MPLSRDVLTRFLGEDGSLQGTVRRVAGATDNLDRRMDRFAKGARTAFISVGVVAAARYGKELFDLGVETQGMQRRFDAVFGAAGDKYKARIDALAESLGIASVRARGMAADVGGVLVNMGLSEDAAAGASVETLRLTDAYEQFFAGQFSGAEIQDKLTRGILGQTRGLVDLNIKLTEADVRARLAETGQDQLTGAARRSAEAQIRLQLILEQSGKVLESYADGETEAERAADKAAATIDELKVSLAQTLVEVAPLIGATADLVSGLQGIPGGANAAIGALAGFKVGGPLGAIIGGVLGFGSALASSDAKLQQLISTGKRLKSVAASMGEDLTELRLAADTMGDEDAARKIKEIEARAIALGAGFGSTEEGAAAAREAIARFLSITPAAVIRARELAVAVGEIRAVSDDTFRDFQGAEAVERFNREIAAISLDPVLIEVRNTADEIISIWEGIPEEIAEFDLAEAILNATSTREAATKFETGMRFLINRGLSATAEELASNPNRFLAIRAMETLMSDVSGAFALEDALTGQSHNALTALASLVKNDPAWAAVQQTFADAGVEGALRFWAEFAAQGPPPWFFQRVADNLIGEIRRGGPYGIS